MTHRALHWVHPPERTTNVGSLVGFLTAKLQIAKLNYWLIGDLCMYNAYRPFGGAAFPIRPSLFVDRWQQLARLSRDSNSL
jgi:hypothetical protein